MRSVALLALGVGCSFSAHGNSGADSGVADAPVPSDGPAVVDALGGPDASLPDGAMPPPPPATCGAPLAMSDDFNTAADWSTLNAAAAGNLVTFGGYDSIAYVFAVPSVSLIDAAQTVQVPATAGSAGITSFFAAWLDGSGYDLIGIDAIGSNLYAGSWSSAGSGSSAMVAYDGSAMAFWQISESAGTVAFATSPDGSAWSAPIYTVPTPAWAPYEHMILEARGSAGYSSMFTALDGSNAGSTMPWCNADTFHGEPDSDSLATWWTNTNVGASSCSFSGSGHVTGTSGSCYYQTSSRYNLVDSSVVVHWGSDTQGTAQPAVALVGTTGSEDLYYNANGNLCDYPESHCTPHTFAPAGSDAYWQISESSATHQIELQISADGSAWVPILLYPEPFVPSGVEIGVGTSQAGSAHILGVN